ncbi:MAG: YicC/YloC family endoribonuclease [Pirellulales bacterium]
MLLSMTGHGEAQRQVSGCAIAVEVRAINNKYFKLSVRAGERFAWLEPQVESVVRQYVRRGTLQVNVWIEREPSPDDFRLNETVLASYRSQIAKIEEHLSLAEPVRLEALMQLPGVVEERLARRSDGDAEWPAVEETLRAALDNLDRMRRDEGRAMVADLRANRDLVEQQLGLIEQRAPQVVENYRLKMVERVNKWLGEFGVQITAGDVVREIGMFTERSDISEEIVRLRSHLSQFDGLIASAEPAGRKLEFLTQEMFREVNTIGSKANDSEIARHVIEIKAAVERIREMIQNVE